MKGEIEETLESLVTSSNSIGRPIITGFNYYPTCLEVDAGLALSLSNVHSAQDYLQKVIQDMNRLGYPNEAVRISFRDKKGYFLWNL